MMSFDILIKNGKLIDGTGNPWFRADLAIKNGIIVKIGKISKQTPRNIINAQDLIVSPGFIDIHSHSDRVIPFDPTTQSTIHQGVTTLVVGQCGYSMAPVHPDRLDLLKKRYSHSIPPGEDLPITWHSFSEYLEACEKLGCASNLITLVGFAAVRIAAMGYENRPPTPEELSIMKGYVQEAMEAGAFGFSTGLIYSPQSFADTQEVIELAKVSAQYNGLYFSHIRNEGEAVVNAVQEAINIAETSNCAGCQISHHKVAGKSFWGLSKETLRLMDNANARGFSVTCDQYPYKRGMAALVTVLPPWSHDGGLEKLIERLNHHEDREQIIKDVSEGIPGWENWIKDVGFDHIYISTAKTDRWKDIIGMNIAQITKIKGTTNDWETLFDLLIDEKGEVASTFESMGDEDIQRIMTSKWTMIGTDGWSVAPTGILNFGKPHPRFYGTYPRILSKYVRDQNILRLEDAIRKMTSYPAQRLGLWNRGVLREGTAADIVVFDPDKVQDKATFEDPHQFPIGIHHVLVNGIFVIKNNSQTDQLPGQILRKSTK